MKKKYVAPITEMLKVETTSLLAALSAIHGEGPGSENINGGGATSTDKPLDAKEDYWNNLWED